MSIKSKLSKVLLVLHEQGAYSAFKYILFRVILQLPKGKWLLDKVIELKANTIYLDGSVFCLDSSYITTGEKIRFLRGTWELEPRFLIKKYLPHDLPVVEFGGCIGAVSCITNKLLTAPEAHIVVEANKNILPILKTNREKNGCQFKIINAAIAYEAEETSLYLKDRVDSGSIYHNTPQSIIVPTTTLEVIIQQEGFARVSLICDIQGTEIDLLRAEGEVISNYVEWIVLETHDQNGSTQAYSLLKSLDFVLIDQFNHNSIYHNQGLMSDTTG